MIANYEGINLEIIRRYPSPPRSRGGYYGAGPEDDYYHRAQDSYKERRRSRSPIPMGHRSRSRSRSPYGRRYPPPPPPPSGREYRDRNRPPREYEGHRRLSPPPPPMMPSHVPVDDYYRRDFREPPMGRRYDDRSRAYGRGYDRGYAPRRSSPPYGRDDRRRDFRREDKK